MRDHDVMIGSRYVPGGGVEGGFTFKRKFMSSGINWYARILLGLTSKDNSGAYRCYRVSKLAQIDLSKVRSRGYSFQEEILYWCKRVGCRIGETPILFENRRFGALKINTARGRLGALDPAAAWAGSRPRIRGSIPADSRSPFCRCVPRRSLVGRRWMIGARLTMSLALLSADLVLADGHIDFLASLGDPLTQTLVLGLELARIHSQDLAQESAVAVVGLVRQLLE